MEDAVGVIRQAFGCFDKEGKGFVSATDISRVLAESGEGDMTDEVSIALSEKTLQNSSLACLPPPLFSCACSSFASKQVSFNVI